MIYGKETTSCFNTWSWLLWPSRSTGFYLFLLLWKLTVPPLTVPSFRSSLSFQLINLLRLWSANLWISLHVHPNERCLSSFKANSSVFTLNWVNKEMAVFIKVVPPPTVSIFFCHLLNANSFIFKLTDKLAKIPFYIESLDMFLLAACHKKHSLFWFL